MPPSPTCGCRIEDYYEPSTDGLRMLWKQRIVFCPLHQAAEAMRTCLHDALIWGASIPPAKYDHLKAVLALVERPDA